MENRITPENITSLAPNEVFVFGSNEQGIHGKGAARVAMDKFGAQKGVGHGLRGQSYAIPTRTVDKLVRGRTRNRAVFKTLPIEKIEYNVWLFFRYVETRAHMKFLVTEIGCGNAGFTPEQIAPMFKDAIHLDNVHLPESFWKILSL